MRQRPTGDSILAMTKTKKEKSTEMKNKDNNHITAPPNVLEASEHAKLEFKHSDKFKITENVKKIFLDNSLFTVKQLRNLSSEEWKQLNIPIALSNTLKAKLGIIGNASDIGILYTLL